MVGPNAAPIGHAGGLPVETGFSEFRYQCDPGDHEPRADDTPDAEIVNFHAEQPAATAGNIDGVREPFRAGISPS
jgi:hypothetical protein